MNHEKINAPYFTPSKQEHPLSYEKPALLTQSLVSIYRVCLVKDHSVSFKNTDSIANPGQAQALFQHLILSRGQPDREQFIVAMLNSNNALIGVNFVSVGSLSQTLVHPREVLKSAILVNSASIMLCHNHPSGFLQPSDEDHAITQKIICAANVVGIQVLEHLIINMDDERYFSFADQGLIAKGYEKAGAKAIAHKIIDHVFEPTRI
jgi:DNA repair protein RadC